MPKLTLDPMAPYFAQMRAFERRLLRSAVEISIDIDQVAAILGVTDAYIKARAEYLGGVFDATPHEPPTKLLGKLRESKRRPRIKHGRGRPKRAMTVTVTEPDPDQLELPAVSIAPPK